jgi:hypothetical protein
MAERIQFDGDNLIIPADIQDLLESFSTIFQQRRASDLPTAATYEKLGFIKQMTQLGATSSVNIAGLPMCALASPPEPIQSGFDSSNNLRLECLHKHQHCWNLAGIKQSC